MPGLRRHLLPPWTVLDRPGNPAGDTDSESARGQQLLQGPPGPPTKERLREQTAVSERAARNSESGLSRRTLQQWRRQQWLEADSDGVGRSPPSPPLSLPIRVLSAVYLAVAIVDNWKWSGTHHKPAAGSQTRSGHTDVDATSSEVCYRIFYRVVCHLCLTTEDV